MESRKERVAAVLVPLSSGERKVASAADKEAGAGVAVATRLLGQQNSTNQPRIMLNTGSAADIIRGGPRGNN